VATAREKFRASQVARHAAVATQPAAVTLRVCEDNGGSGTVCDNPDAERWSVEGGGSAPALRR
jgi:hypothetical protein